MHYGVNEVDINGDGVKDMIVKVRWDNMNAHSFDKYLVAVRVTTDDEGEKGLIEVPLGELYTYQFMASETADCADDSAYEPNQITSYKFELDKRGWLRVTEYNRSTPEGFFDQEHRTSLAEVTTYKLVDSFKGENGGEPGMPHFYLKKAKTKLTKKKYCDMRDAINAGE